MKKFWTLSVLVLTFIVFSFSPNFSSKALAAPFSWVDTGKSISNSLDTTSRYPSLAIDYFGNIHAVWLECGISTCSPYTIYHSIKRGSSPWSTPEQVDSGLIGSKSLASDKLGNVHLVYINHSTKQAYYRVYNGTSWGLPNPIENAENTSSISIKVDDSGTPHVVWVSGGASLYYSKLEKGKWSPYYVPVATTASISNFVIDHSGIVHIVWSDSSGKISYRRLIDHFYSDIKVFSYASSFNPDIALDSNGNLHIVWGLRSTGTYRWIYYTRLSKGDQWEDTKWLPSVRIYENPYDLGAVNLVADDFGKVHLVWDNIASSWDIFYLQWDKGSWAPSINNISNNRSTSAESSVAVDKHGNIHVAWRDGAYPLAGKEEIYYTSKENPLRFDLPIQSSFTSFNETMSKCTTSLFDHQYPYQNPYSLPKRDGFVLPYTGVKIVNPNGDCELGISCYDGHEGIDFDDLQGCGTIGIAAADGEVIEATCENSSYGCHVILKHGNTGYSTLYGHFEYSSFYRRDPNTNAYIYPKSGFVTAGTPLGVIGNTGNSIGTDGTHLHFSVLYDGVKTTESGAIENYRVNVDPSGWLVSSPDPWEGYNRNQNQWAKSLYMWKDELFNAMRYTTASDLTIVSPSKNISISIPAGAYSEELNFILSDVPLINIVMKYQQVDFRSAIDPFWLYATDLNGTSVTSFSVPITASLHFNESDIKPSQQDRVEFCTLNETTETWEQCQKPRFDWENHTVTVQLTHLSYYALFIPPENLAPIIELPQTWEGLEGNELKVNGTVVDPDSDNWSGEVDYGDGSGIQPLLIQNGRFELVHTFLDNQVYDIAVTIKDSGNLSSVTHLSANIQNVIPSAHLVTSPEVIEEGSEVQLSLIDPSDPSSVDTNSGFTFTFDCTNDGLFDIPEGPNPSFKCYYSDNGSYFALARIMDKDGGFTDYQVNLIVDNVAPTAEFSASKATVYEGENTIISFNNPFDPSQVDRAAGLEYAVNCGTENTAEPVYSQNSTFTCHYVDNGIYLARGWVKDKNEGIRIYTITIDVKNAAPEITSLKCPIDPVKVGAEATIVADFTDKGLNDTHYVLFDWGNGQSSQGTVISTDGFGSIVGQHIYNSPGVFSISLSLRDTDEGEIISTCQQYLVTYDPDGSFVTGGGWINSPLGAYKLDQTLTGKASFGFVSKYQKGALVPSGNTEFVYTTANFAFKSISYDWLVISGARAQYKGLGTINGAGNYAFILTAIDGQVNGGGGVDRIRLKIWDKTTGEIIYDNQMSTDDMAEPITTLGGGSIVIHK